MAVIAIIIGVALIIGILWEGFEVIVLPRRVTRTYRISVFTFRLFWGTWRAVGRKLAREKREAWLSIYGPLSLLLLIVVWGAGIVAGFALLEWGIRGTGRGVGFGADLFFSATTFISLSLGEVVARTAWGRVLAVAEAALGFGLLALFIAYFPALNQSFSRRETSISLLDARAGSPPTAAEMLRRHRGKGGIEALREVLGEWERWAAELLESHQSYPVLAYFRSQHENQSWLGALTAVLDTCTLVMVGLEEVMCKRQAELTFAVARHAVVDLSLVFRRPPQKPEHDRLPPEGRQALRGALAAEGVTLRSGQEAEEELERLRGMYEPYATSLSAFFEMELPPWLPPEMRQDDWQVSEWEGKPTPRGRRARPERGGAR